MQKAIVRVYALRRVCWEPYVAELWTSRSGAMSLILRRYVWLGFRGGSLGGKNIENCGPSRAEPRQTEPTQARWSQADPGRSQAEPSRAQPEPKPSTWVVPTLHAVIPATHTLS